jgi:hypothetical protein
VRLRNGRHTGREVEGLRILKGPGGVQVCEEGDEQPVKPCFAGRVRARSAVRL